MQKMEIKAQGTIEYLIIMGIIIVLGLVVVGILSTFMGPSSKTVDTSGKIRGLAGEISIIDSAIDNEGDGIFVFQPNTTDNLTLTKLSVSGIDVNLSEQLVGLSRNKIETSNLTTACCQGEVKGVKICPITLTYTTPLGLTKTYTVEIAINCVDDLNITSQTIDTTPPSVALLSPVNDYNDDSSEITITYTASDAGRITNCSLIINGVVDQTDSDGSYGAFTKTIPNQGTYIWDVNCTDNNSNTAGSGTPRTINSTILPRIALSATGSGDSAEYARTVYVDSSGNTYVGGDAYSTIDFGGGNTVENTGSSDFFIAKYNSSGTIQWARGEQTGTAVADDYLYDITGDDSGNIYAVGATSAYPIIFSSDVNIASGSSSNLFLVKYNSSGTAQWVKTATGTWDDVGDSVTLDASGNIYVAGRTRSPTLDFGNGVTVSANNDSNYTTFVVKYNSSGVAQWANASAGASSNYPHGVGVDSSGNVYVGGYFVGGMDTSFGGITLTNRGSYDFFLVKYNSSGTIQWALNPQAGTGSDNDDIAGLSVAPDDNIYITGYTWASLGFPGGKTVPSSSGSAEFFIAKIYPDGNAAWAIRTTGTGSDYGYGIHAYDNNTIYVTGEFASATLDFNNSQVLTRTSASTLKDFFLAKYAGDGNVVWAKMTQNDSGTRDDRGRAVYSNGSVTSVVGFTDSNMDFGNSKTITVDGNNNLFVASYNTSGTAQWASSPQGNSSATSYEVVKGVSIADDNTFCVAGSYQSSLNFGNNISLDVSTGRDLMLIKYDANGTPLWARSTMNGSGSGSGEYFEDVYTDSSGNIYASGYFNSGNLEFGNNVLKTNSGSVDAIAIKYNSSGTAQLALDINGTKEDYALKIKADSSGNIYVAGNTKSQPINFGNGVTYYSSNDKNRDVFVAKFNSSGVAQWAKGGGSQYDDYVKGLVVDSGGNVYINGYSGSADANFDGTILPNQGSLDIFLVKYDSSGNLQWVKSSLYSSGTSTDYADGLAIDSTDNLYFLGHTYSSLKFASDINISNTSSGDMFLVKYNSSGDAQWLARATGSSNEVPYSVSADNNAVYVSGSSLSSTINFGNGYTFTNRGAYDVYATKYALDTNTLLWAKMTYSGTGNDYGYAIAGKNNRILIGGNYASPDLNFGANKYLTNTGSSDIFIVEYR
jgi:hypothetical protein